MDPRTVIESYVDDVVRRLPRGQRSDVAFELTALLAEELQGRADEAGRPADEAMALALLQSFGRPEDVAQRYGPSGFTIIKPAAGPGFAAAALIGVAVQWALTLPAALMSPQAHVGAPGSSGDVLAQLGRWWLTWGVGAFWLPGFMVVMSIFAAWIGERWPARAGWAPRPVLDRDRINRPVLALGLGAWAAYMALLAAAPSILGALPRPLATALAFDPEFLRTRGPWLFPIWVGQWLVVAMAWIEARWTRRTRLLNLAFGAALCAVLAWCVVAGPIFAQPVTDQTLKGILGLVILLSLLSLGLELYRQPGRPAPQGLATPPRA